MEKLLEDVASGYWWISVVVLSLALNITASFLTAPIARFFDRLQKRRMSVVTKDSRQSVAHALRCEKQPGHLHVVTARMLRHYIAGATMLVMSIVVAVAGLIIEQAAPTSHLHVRVLLALLPGATMFAALIATNRARRYSRSLLIYEQKLRESAGVTNADVDEAMRQIEQRKAAK